MFGLGGDESARLLYLVLLLAFLAGGISFSRGRLGPQLRHLMVWALIVVALVAVYAYRAPLMRFATPILHELDPSRVVEITSPDGATELMIARGGDGHFHLNADVNGVPVEFLVDTGATSTVLTLRDAERVGIDTAQLNFNRPVSTANGMAFFAATTARSIDIGPYRLSGQPVGVMPADTLSTSLLGMSTINRFGGWRVEGNRMVLMP